MDPIVAQTLHGTMSTYSGCLNGLYDFKELLSFAVLAKELENPRCFANFVWFICRVLLGLDYILGSPSALTMSTTWSSLLCIPSKPTTESQLIQPRSHKEDNTVAITITVIIGHGSSVTIAAKFVTPLICFAWLTT